MAHAVGRSSSVAGRHPSAAGRRWLAVIALATGAVLVAVVVVFFLRHPLSLVIGIGGMMLAAVGGWWAVTERRPRRAVGVVVLVVGALVVIAAVVVAGGSALDELGRVVLTLVLLAVTVVAARAALADRLRAQPRYPVHLRPRPRRSVLLCNPWSGGGKVHRFGLVDLAESMGVEVVLLDDDHSLVDLARDAVRRGADCLGMAGGDGSLALVSSIAVAHHLPFVCVPAGTRNHFALDLGLNRDDPRPALEAFDDAVERRVDYATVNGRPFVNNVSLGVYATVVQQEGYRDAKLETSKGALPDLVGRTAEPFDLQFTEPEGRFVDSAFLIMVSNNPYVLDAKPDFSQRHRLDSGRLGVFAVTATTGVQVSTVALAMARRGGNGTHAFRFTARDFDVRSHSGHAEAGVDGEALELTTPLHFHCYPGALRLLVPRSNPEAALRRQAREVTVADLVSIARGHPQVPQLQ